MYSGLVGTGFACFPDVTVKQNPVSQQRFKKIVTVIINSAIKGSSQEMYVTILIEKYFFKEKRNKNIIQL